ncbi:MAG: branched-chain amino acid ABC transporter permease [Gammaproteobacteria bacterium]|nr:branched-chain amino acid ABC transporter permease [Gammaproteobacteria bacterium]MDA7969204.1 branched-chain amino acid ABC transporter permease [Gammaproteobacteria bacterium]MDA7995556.1 branched-chain amino acid ABC transporter permease [Gammaproteobacteria bacterium]MDA8023385.1 branched-chain amino acid ABC transporter permease [Gammaproteobacteria bacterium]CAJ2375922.1 MAG: Amino acid/amide ABC transporter membrane protein 1, HAAT family [Arenicellales bacterium IbO2]
MDWHLLFAQLLNGLQLGLLLFLLAAGLSLIFGIMDFINLSHGSFYMLGAFVCATVAAVSGSFFLAVLAAAAATFAAGALVERCIARKLYARGHLEQVLVTYGLILIFDELAHLVWGPAGAAIALPAALEGRVDIGGVGVPRYRLLIIMCGLLVAAGMYFLVTRSRLGMLIRAGASNRAMAAALGVNIDRLYLLVFAIGAALAGLAGALIAPLTEASIGMGGEIIIIAFVVVIVGGIGSVKGAFCAALLIGFIDTLGRAYLDDLLKLFLPGAAAETAAPALSAMSVYVLMACVLALKPRGLFAPAGAGVKT